MSRLIDAKHFKRFLQALCKAGAPYDEVIQLLDKEPTVYEIDTVKKGLKELKQYRAIGTIEEFKALKDKSVAKKIINIQINKMQSFCEDDFGRNMPCIVNVFQFKCPNCNKKIASRFKIRKCPDCEQKLDWQ